MKFLLHIILLCSVLGFAQNSNTESLIVVHYDEANKANLGQLIYRYNFEDNAYTGRELIMPISGKKNGKDYVRCDVGENTLYKDRYLISGIGNVIDLKEKKVLHDGTAKFVRCSNDSIIFFTNDIFKGKYYSYFDLKTNTYSEIKSLTFKAILGQAVEFDRRTSPYKLEYFPVGKPKVLLMEDAGHGGVSSTDKKTDIPIYWIDDYTFLFPNIKITDLEGTIVKYNLTTSTAKTLGTFNSVSKVPATYKLAKGRNSFVEFYFKEKLYILNPAKETMLISNYKEVDSNYSIEVEAKAKGRSIYYKGAEIGKHHFALHTFKVGTNYSAFLKEIVMGDESYQQGLSVYVTALGKWQNIATIDIASVVGWINKNNSMVDNKIIVGISQGDLNGIGLEIILKTLSDPMLSELCVPVLFSSQKTVSYFRKMLNLEEFNFHPTRDFNQLNTKKPNVFICYEEEVTIEMGKATTMSGKYAKLSLEAATMALFEKKIDVLVTAPINKHSMQEAGFNYPGHTEYLGEKLGGKPLMLLCSGDLRVAIVTGHLPVKSISEKITTANVLEKINQLHSSLVKDFGIRKPKIAVLGLNPHAGENGAIGDEEKTAIIPAIEKAKETMMVYGPYSADGFFGNNTQAQFDGVLAMYHDQGLIPFKTLAFGHGVNFTAGLDFVRTSPDHGTAYEIAGKQIADESSFRDALYAAVDIYRKRELLEEISANPLAFAPIKKERG